MDNKKTVKKYFNKYFKAQYLDEDSHEFKALVRILNKANKPVKKLILPIVSKSFTAKQIVDLLENEETLDDAILFFKEKE